MISTIATGSAVVLIAGALQGVFAVPMKFARRWNYENIWLIFAITGLVIFPWILTSATVPHLVQVYRLTPTATLIAIAGFGLCWGIGATLTGLGLNMLGIGLGLAIILGLSASVGSLIPLLVLTPEKIGTYQGHVYMVGTAIMLLGIACGARAGFLREKGSNNHLLENSGLKKGSFFAGLLIVTASGLLSSALNFCYAFGGAAMAATRHLGVSPIWSSNVITALATTGGFVANLLYCAYLLRKNSTAKLFWSSELRVNWIYGAIMGACWFGGQALYGLGVSRMGSFGTVLGWPLLMGMIIITSNAAGFLTGEWKGTAVRSRMYLLSGMALIIVALGVLSLGHMD
ncbi:MAG TPA: L-rhamnose/proton symporter RhaT [Acidobacteriaceae bacterium]|jgi:L-rhamnose-H+ transport protein|nr:L-rhamnose/proton symporter RhaT [Acidobacteriaceae bacterium]